MIYSSQTFLACSEYIITTCNSCPCADSSAAVVVFVAFLLQRACVFCFGPVFPSFEGLTSAAYTQAGRSVQGPFVASCFFVIAYSCPGRSVFGIECPRTDLAAHGSMHGSIVYPIRKIAVPNRCGAENNWKCHS